ncbi:MAG: SGNH/GDSL hydrolase family protein [Clostridia bacterium]|nr:SGNH/GDSL hydrolase family protein [Clostridia bacterium]
MKIVFFGDSITDAGRSRERDYVLSSYGYGYVNQCAAALLSENANGYQIVNRGISGNRVVDLYARIKADVWQETPDVLSILIGVNDVWHELSAKPNGVEVERFEKVYRMLLDDTKKVLPNTKIIICEPFFLRGTATEDPENPARYAHFCTVPKYAEAARRIANDYGLPFVALQAKMTEAAEKYGVAPILSDGVHPAVAGAAIIAKEWLKVFKKEIVKE